MANFIQKAKLVAAAAVGGDQAGWSVAVSGHTAIVGAIYADAAGANFGAAFVFVGAGGGWAEQQTLCGSTTAASDRFGSSVAIDGETAVVGAFYDDDAGASSGTAWVFTRAAGVWTEQQKLIGADTGASDYFGRAVAIDGDSIIVGAYGDDDIAINSGAAYIFTRAVGVWSEQQKLKASDAAGSASYSAYPQSVAISGDTAVVGAAGNIAGGLENGCAYVYTRTAGVWSEQQQLFASDMANYVKFGYAVALEGDTLVVGAPTEDTAASNAGAVYVFTRTGGVWTERAILYASDPGSNKYFGVSVAISGGCIIVGANGRPGAYLFQGSGATWTQLQILVGDRKSVV